MKLWSAMQRIEALRYQAERLDVRAERGGPEHRRLMLEIKRQLEELAVQTQALLEERAPPRITPLGFDAAEVAESEAADRQAA
jgi:hypothetical protein